MEDQYVYFIDTLKEEVLLKQFQSSLHVDTTSKWNLHKITRRLHFLVIKCNKGLCYCDSLREREKQLL